mgnify:CR=1 FL=1
MKNFLASGLFGVTSLLLINVTSALTGIGLTLSKLSLAVSAVLGVPGVLTMLLVNTFL